MIDLSVVGDKGLKGLMTLLVALAAGACSHTAVVPAYEPSDVRYAPSGQRLDVAVSDARPTGSEFSHGRVTIHVQFAGGDPNELSFFTTALAKELSQRGVESKVSTQASAGAGGLKVTLRRFEIRNARSTGFSPLIAYGLFAADVNDGRETVRVVGYAKNGKVPAWSMSEVDRPCYADTLHELVGEVASKINRRFIGAASSDALVAELEKAANGEDGAEALQATYELGFTNNPKAVPALVKLVEHESERVRAAALSGLGVLGASSELGMLEDVHVNGKSASDRYLALKAIGDLGTAEALAYLEHAKSGAEGREANDTAELVSLYLDERPSGSVAPPQSEPASEPVSEPPPVQDSEAAAASEAADAS